MRAASMIALAAAALTLGLAVHVRAEGQPDPLAEIEPQLDPGVLLQGVVREDDLSLLFAHLRAALVASYQGREAPSSGELDRRMESIVAEMKARGALTGLALLAALEAAARQALRDAVPAPAPR